MPKGKNKTKPKHNQTDFQYPEMTTVEGNRVQEVAEVTDFFSVQKIVVCTGLSGEYISCRLPGRLRHRKRKNTNIEVGSHVLISRRMDMSQKSNYKGKKIDQGDIIIKYSEDQWNELKYNPIYVTQKNIHETEADDAAIDFVFDDI